MAYQVNKCIHVCIIVYSSPLQVTLIPHMPTLEWLTLNPPVHRDRMFWPCSDYVVLRILKGVILNKMLFIFYLSPQFVNKHFSENQIICPIPKGYQQHIAKDIFHYTFFPQMYYFSISAPVPQDCVKVNKYFQNKRHLYSISTFALYNLVSLKVASYFFHH